MGGGGDFPNSLNEGTTTVFQNNIPWEKGIDGCKIKCLTLALFSSGSNSHKLVLSRYVMFVKTEGIVKQYFHD